MFYRRYTPRIKYIDPREHSSGSYDNDSYELRDTHTTIDIHAALNPLINQIKMYDALRILLEQHGGHMQDLKRISTILTEELQIRGKYWPHKVTLANHTSIHDMLNDLGNYKIHFEVRKCDTGMPIYYLCRTRQDYWAEYSLIVEDLYKSPHYPMPDERLVKLMYCGHETFYLRLSNFRDAVTAEVASIESDNVHESVDEILYNLGRYVFQAAWHEDQRLAIEVSAHFRLNNFRYCIELLYLCLSGELCELRSTVNDKMLLFFEQVYPQPAIRSFLDSTLTSLDGGALNLLPQKALRLYEMLSAAFSCFLGIEVLWGKERRTKISLYKLIYGNFLRLHLVGKELMNNNEVQEGALRLEAQAQAIIREIMDADKVWKTASIFAPY